MANYTYEVWALGFDKDNMCTDIEKLLGTQVKEKVLEGLNGLTLK